MATPPPSTPCPRRIRASRGFTLVELMVVIVILGGLIAIVGPNVFRALGESDIQRAKTQMANFETALTQYYFNNRKLPSDLQALTEVDPKTGEPLMKSIPMDPWGNPYELKLLGGKDYQIVCHGEDGQEGTQDDIRWPEEEQE